MILFSIFTINLWGFKVCFGSFHLLFISCCPLLGLGVRVEIQYELCQFDPQQFFPGLRLCSRDGFLQMKMLYFIYFSLQVRLRSLLQSLRYCHDRPFDSLRLRALTLLTVLAGHRPLPLHIRQCATQQRVVIAVRLRRGAVCTHCAMHLRYGPELLIL